MNLYLVHGLIATETTVETFAQWCGTQAECASARKAFAERGAKKADIFTREIDVPTNKAGLLEFLNKGQHS